MANVIVINPFEVPKGKEGQALAMWDTFAEYFRRQPGYVSSKLHRAINPDARFHLVTVAEWTSPDHFVAALENPELQNMLETATDHSPNYPGLYEVIRT
ncbi:MAG TPA: antibiotic biosynthesis monooxygenase family protein [Thiobacillus sp.]|nr:antibiotic biosynthesis monooxygenase family protein [Thiobacillus sp.]